MRKLKDLNNPSHIFQGLLLIPCIFVIIKFSFFVFDQKKFSLILIKEIVYKYFTKIVWFDFLLLWELKSWLLLSSIAWKVAFVNLTRFLHMDFPWKK